MHTVAKPLPLVLHELRKHGYIKKGVDFMLNYNCEGASIVRIRMQLPQFNWAPCCCCFHLHVD